jgi:hypothetical protein
MASRQVPPKKKQKLKAIYERLNPAELHRWLTNLRAELEAFLSRATHPDRQAARLGWAGDMKD